MPRFLVCVFLVTIPFLSAANWPEFRGPSGQGITDATGLPIKWSEKENVRWFTNVEGLGWSSPVVVGERIYLTTAVSSGTTSASYKLVCLNANNGNSIFSKEVFPSLPNPPAIHDKNSQASPTPLISGDRVYLHFGHEGTACVDLNGDNIWSNRNHVYAPVHGNGGSPVLVDNSLLVFTCDGSEDPYTVALDAKSGREVWKTPRKSNSSNNFSFCTPLVIEIDGKKQIVSPGSNLVQSLNPADGSVIWSVKYDGFSVVPRPIMHKGMLFITTGFMTAGVLAIDPNGKGDVSKSHVKWTYKNSNVPTTPSLVARENVIMMISDKGIATGLDAKTGTELWKFRVGGNHSASPILAGSKIYFQSEAGESSVYELGRSTLEDVQPVEIARSTVPGRTLASLAVVDNDFLLRSDTGIYRIGN